MGALVSEEQFERVSQYVEIGRKEGANVALGGGPGDGDGYFYKPTVFTDVRPEQRIAQEEIFGPVVATTTFADEEEALAIANGVTYGLASGIWTNNLSRAHRVAQGLKAGTVWVNTYNALWNEAPFGGYKQSGHGREGGRYGAELYTEIKNVCIYI
jgi:acyl-CoA reductase-like NAD-dependent aldehyde dehydrogenase